MTGRAGWTGLSSKGWSVGPAATGAPPYGADADRLRRSAARLRHQLTAAGFRARTEEGKRLDGHQVIDLALDAVARFRTGLTRPGPGCPAASGRLAGDQLDRHRGDGAADQARSDASPPLRSSRLPAVASPRPVNDPLAAVSSVRVSVKAAAGGTGIKAARCDTAWRRRRPARRTAVPQLLGSEGSPLGHHAGYTCSAFRRRLIEPDMPCALRGSGGDLR